MSIRPVVVLAVVLAGCACDPVESHQLLVARGDPMFAPLIARCAASDHDCLDLCGSALAAVGLAFPEPGDGSRFTRCLMREYDAATMWVETTLESGPGTCE